jgi:hypothetical protein
MAMVDHLSSFDWKKSGWWVSSLLMVAVAAALVAFSPTVETAQASEDCTECYCQ